MTKPDIRFNDGAAYERMMGVWSRLAGDVFLDWLAPEKGLRWIDVGCGNGAFTERVVERCAPASIEGIDPSEAQLAYARERHKAGIATYRNGDAMALPFANDSFDIAASALVLFFVPDPGKAVAEMARVTKPGGIVATYLWDIPGAGLPMAPVGIELRALGAPAATPPSAGVSKMENLRTTWEKAGLAEIDTREIAVERTFESFDEFWDITVNGTALREAVNTLNADDASGIKQRVRSRLAINGVGRVLAKAKANAIRGRVSAGKP